MLPIPTTLHQHYSPICYNNDPVDKNNITLVTIEKEMLPLTSLLQQGYSLFLYNDDPMDEMNITPTKVN